MPRIWSIVHHHPIPAKTKSSATSPSRARAAAKATPRPLWSAGRSWADAINGSGSPGEYGIRYAGLAFVLDAEGVDPALEVPGHVVLLRRTEPRRFCGLSGSASTHCVVASHVACRPCTG